MAIFGEGEPNETSIGGGQAIETGFAAKFEADGSLIWAKGYGSNNATVLVRVGGALPDGGAVIAGSLRGQIVWGEPGNLQAISNAAGDNFIFRLNAAGDAVWVRQIRTGAGPATTIPTGLEIDEQSGFALCGIFQRDVTFGVGEVNETTLPGRLSDEDGYLARYDSEGNLAWARHIMTGTARERPQDVIWLRDGGLALACRTSADITFMPGTPQAVTYPISEDNSVLGVGFIAKFASSGSLEWVRQTGGGGNCSLAAAPDGGIYNSQTDQSRVPFEDGQGGLVWLEPGVSESPDELLFTTCISNYTSHGRLKLLKRVGNPGRIDYGSIAIREDSRILFTGQHQFPVTLQLGDSTPINIEPNGGTEIIFGLTDLLSTMNLNSPRGSELLQGDSLIEVSWTNRLNEVGTGLRFELRNAQGVIMTLGYGWSPAESGTAWVYLPLMPEGDDYVIREVSTWDPTLFADSEPFTIAGGAIRVNAPNGGEVWPAGAQRFVNWQASVPFAGTGVSLELWDNNGPVADLGGAWDPDGEGVAVIQVPLVPAGADYRVRASSTWNPNYTDLSDAPFTIESPITGSADKNAVALRHWLIFE